MATRPGANGDAPGPPLTRWLLLLAAALAMVLRAPVYLVEPSFWAEEGTLYFAVAWDHPLREALGYRPAGYLLLWANLATTAAAWLVRTGLLPLLHAPQVTALCALLAQLAPVAVIVWSRAPFWNGAIRRLAGLAICLVGVLTDEIWFNTVNSQPWLVLAAALLLLEPAASNRLRSWAAGGLLALAGLSAPVASVLAPLHVWRAWCARTRPAAVQAAIVVGCALVQAWCVWAALQGPQPLPSRTAATTPAVFAATVWMRTLVVPLAGTGAARALGLALANRGGLGPLESATLLVAAAALIGWLARGLRAADRLPLVGAYALVTTLTLLTVVGNKSVLLHSPWASSRYVYVPGVVVLLLVLGGVRRDVGWLRAALCGLVLAIRLAQGLGDYRESVRWKPDWPRWPEQVARWEADPAWPLAIWPPPWRMSLSPAPVP